MYSSPSRRRVRLLLPEAVAEVKCVGRTGADALAAADALRVVRRLQDVDIHGAGFRALPAGNTGLSIGLDREQRHAIHECVEGTERTEPLAERAVDKDAQNDNHNQDEQLPAEKRTERRTDAGVCQRKRDRALEYALRAEVLAEKRIAHAELVDREGREQHHHEEQHEVLHVRERLQLLRGELLPRELVQQLLEPAERAQKAADEAAEQYAEEDQEAGDVVGEAEARRADHGLEGTDRAGTGRRRAGIAVEPRNAGDLALPLVDAACPKIRQVEVREQRRHRLDAAAETADHF